MCCGSILLQFPCVFYFHFFSGRSDGLALLLGNLVVVVFFDRNKGWIKIIDRSERFWGDFRPMSYFARGFVEDRLVFCHEEEESWSTLR